MRQVLSAILVYLLVLLTILAPAAEARASSAQTPNGAAQKPTFKEQILEIPAGSVVQVKLKPKGELRGHLGNVTDEGFVVKVAHGNTIEEKKLTFDQVKSIRLNKGTATWVYILAGVGITLVGLPLYFVQRWPAKSTRESPTECRVG
jgi:hypothetical protein